MAYDD